MITRIQKANLTALSDSSERKNEDKNVCGQQSAGVKHGVQSDECYD